MAKLHYRSVTLDKPRADCSDLLHRGFNISGHFTVADEKTRTVKLFFSDESRIQRPFGCEILDHGVGSADFSRLTNSPLMLEQDQQVGVVEDAWLDESRKGRARVRFSMSQLGGEVFRDVVDEIRCWISVAYVINKTVRNGGTNRVISWTPLEIGFVSRLPEEFFTADRR